jgi:hypothetical protein
MRFTAKNGHVDVDTTEAGSLLLSVTAVSPWEDKAVIGATVAIMDGNHAQALAQGLLAACQELQARAVDP